MFLPSDSSCSFPAERYTRSHPPAQRTEINQNVSSVDSFPNLRGMTALSDDREMQKNIASKIDPPPPPPYKNHIKFTQDRERQEVQFADLFRRSHSYYHSKYYDQRWLRFLTAVFAGKIDSAPDHAVENLPLVLKAATFMFRIETPCAVMFLVESLHDSGTLVEIDRVYGTLGRSRHIPEWLQGLFVREVLEDIELRCYSRGDRIRCTLFSKKL
ncbi:hypothetical protein ACMFMG_003553 [Clarireedia jacksonii]